MKIKKKTPNEVVLDIASKFTFERKLAFLLTIIISFIIHFPIMANDINNPDDILFGDFHGFSKWELSLGRWALSIVSLIRGSVVSPVLSTINAIVLMGIVAIVLIELLDIKKVIHIVLVSAILASMPTFAVTLSYNYCSDAYILAMFLSFLAVYFIYKKSSIKYFILASTCFAVSMGLYQAYIGVTVGLCVIVPILEILRNVKDTKKIFIDILKSIGMVILGISIYYVITQLSLYIFNIEVASYCGANKIGLSIFKTLPQAIQQTYMTFYEFFFKNNIIKNSYWKREYLNAIFFIILAISFLIVVVKNKICKNPIKVVMLVFGIIIMPIAIGLIEIIAQEKRINILMGGALYLPLIMFVAILDMLDKNKGAEFFLNWMGVTICVIIIATYAFSIQATYLAREQTYNQAYSTMIRIIDRMETNENYKTGMKVCFIGEINNKIYPRDSKVYDMAVGYISNWGEFWISRNGSNISIKNFIEKYLGLKIDFCTVNEFNKIIRTEEYKGMKVFPSNESIKVINDIMVVKLK